MNSGPTSEHAYAVLKQRLLAGEFRPGQRLEPAEIGRMLGISITPVRDALHVLTGEALVETRTSDGFHVPEPTEEGLHDLYAWNAQVLLAAISTWPRRRQDDQTQLGPPPPSEGVTDPFPLFEWIAARSKNQEHLRAIISTGERLRAARRAESAVWSDLTPELGALTDIATGANRSGLRLLVKAYHRRRLRSLSSILSKIRKE